MRRTTIVILTALVALAAACSSSVVPTASPAPTAPPTTPTTEPEPGPTWPLTGLPVDDEAELERPAVVAKIDNAAAARPHAGLEVADIVYEVVVEGITRFAAVFHSQTSDHVGPVRSARSTDVDLVANLRRPVLVWSGGNPGVLGEIQAAADGGLLVNANHDLASGEYWRQPGRSGPHNLFANVAAIQEQFGVLDGVEPGPVGPEPLFTYRDEDDEAVGFPAAGVIVDFGEGSAAQYVWDEEAGCARRFQGADAFRAESGAHICPTNLVVLFTEYGNSIADARSPQAYTVGSGDGFALTGGHLIPLTWDRPDRAHAAELRDSEGEPVELDPGRTWVGLPRQGAHWDVLSEEQAEELLANVDEGEDDADPS